MKKISWFLLVLVATSLTACAPAYYEATYRDYYQPSGHLSVVTNSYDFNDDSAAVHGYSSIEVMLFSNQVVTNAVFQPIRLIIHDGDFLEVPIRGRNGGIKRAYAHYYRGDLHFDSRRACSGVPGSSRYKYNKRWDKGHRYDNINAGPEYDMRGLSLVVRKYAEKNGDIVRGASKLKKSRKGVSEKAVTRSGERINNKKVHGVALKKNERVTKKTAKVAKPNNKRSGSVVVRPSERPVSGLHSKAPGGSSLSGKATKDNVRLPDNKRKPTDRVDNIRKVEIDKKQTKQSFNNKTQEIRKNKGVVSSDHPSKVKGAVRSSGLEKNSKNDYRYDESVVLVVDEDVRLFEGGKGRRNAGVD